MLKEEAMAIKVQLQNSDYDDFSPLDGWLDCWKATYTVKERRVFGEAGDVYRSGYFIDGVDKRIE